MAKKGYVSAYDTQYFGAHPADGFKAAMDDRKVRNGFRRPEAHNGGHTPEMSLAWYRRDRERNGAYNETHPTPIPSALKA